MENKQENCFMIFLFEFFYILSFSVIIFIIMEVLYPRIILAYFNINILLLFWLIIAMIIILNPEKIKKIWKKK